MKIGFDGLAFQKTPSGIGKYFLSLIALLVKRYPEYEYYCYSNKQIYMPNYIERHVTYRIDKKITSNLKANVWIKTKAGSFIEKDILDYYISSAGIFPNISRRIKRVALIHDLNYRIVPKTMGSLNWLTHFLFLKKDVRKAHFVIANSTGTAEKIHLYLGKKCDIIINPPTSNIFIKLPDKEVLSIREKYKLTFPYFLTVGAIEPRKNLTMTINVFLDLVKNNKHKEHKLVIVGGGGWKNAKILKLLESNKEYILRLGYVPDQDLPSLYNGASAFLFPSIYEGFGMPVREAIYCQCPVITSNIDELHESSKGVASYINPRNKVEYENAMMNILNNGYLVFAIDKSENELMHELFLSIFK